MASRNIFLTERGFGNPKKGSATIICGKQGQPLPMRLLTLPNNNIGGEVIIVPNRNSSARSYITTEEIVYEIQLNQDGSLGTIRIREFAIINNEIIVDICETAFVVDNKGMKLVHSEGMENSQKADDLLNGVLGNAFVAALKRASIAKPGELFFGIIAKDGSHQKRTWFDKTSLKPKEEVLVAVSQ